MEVLELTTQTAKINEITIHGCSDLHIQTLPDGEGLLLESEHPFTLSRLHQRLDVNHPGHRYCLPSHHDAKYVLRRKDGYKSQPSLRKYSNRYRELEHMRVFESMYQGSDMEREMNLPVYDTEKMGMGPLWKECLCQKPLYYAHQQFEKAQADGVVDAEEIYKTDIEYINKWFPVGHFEAECRLLRDIEYLKSRKSPCKCKWIVRFPLQGELFINCHSQTLLEIHSKDEYHLYRTGFRGKVCL